MMKWQCTNPQAKNDDGVKYFRLHGFEGKGKTCCKRVIKLGQAEYGEIEGQKRQITIEIEKVQNPY